MTKEERLQQIWHKYDSDHKHKPTSAREAVEWAIAERILDLPEIDPVDVLAGQMAQALRDEYQTDDKGRRYRVNHAARVTKTACNIRFGASWDSLPMSTWSVHLHGDVSKL